MAEILKSTNTWSALLLGAMVLLATGCGGGSSTASPDPLPDTPPAFSDDFPWRISSLAIPEWYTTLTTQPVALIDGEVASWSWAFGAGAIPATSTEPQPTITLQAPGDYLATLTITDSAGHVGRIPVAYRVLPPTSPTIDAVSPSGEAGGEFTMATFGVTTSGPPVTSWSWDFGDGAFPAHSTESEPQVELQHIGGHTGTIEVCGPFGCREQEFEYGIRAPQAVWHDFPLAVSEIPRRLAMCSAPDGSPRLFLTIGTEMFLAQPNPTATGNTDFWSMTWLLDLTYEYVSTFEVEASPEAMYLFISYPSYPAPVKDSTISRISFDGQSVWTLPLPNTWGLNDSAYSSIASQQMESDASRLYLAVSDKDTGGRSGLLTFPLGDLVAEGPMQYLTPYQSPWAGGSDLLGFAMRSVDGVLYQAQVRSEGAQEVEPGTLAVGRLTGNVADGDAGWVKVDLDASARGSHSMGWIDTSSGLHLLYGVYHDTGAICDSDGFCSPIGDDYGIRQAWTPNRTFASASEWQTGRSIELGGIWSPRISEIRGQPFVLGYGGTNLSVSRGFSEVAGDIPWQKQFLTIGTISLDRVASTSATDGVWVCGWDYQKWVSWGGGNSGGGFDPADPILFVGKVTLE